MKKLQEIKESDIEDQYTVCVYCFDPYDEESLGCCGEIHSEMCYFIKDGEAYLESDVKIVP